MESSEKLCMICLKTNSKFYDLWDLSDSKTNYIDKLRDIVDISIIPPQNSCLCEDCVSDLNKAFEFKERVEKSQQFWKTQKVEHPDQSESDRVSINNIIYENDNNDTDSNSEREEDNLQDNNREQTDKPSCSDASQAAYSCNHCSSKFETVMELISHTCFARTVGAQKRQVKKASKERGFRCNRCNQVFDNRWDLNKHKKSNHTEDSTYICFYCGKSLRSLATLNNHLSTHDSKLYKSTKKNVPFLCNICGKRLPYSNTAQRHMRTHTGERRHQCNVCNKLFAQASHLRVHMRTHTGEKPFFCTMCNASFSLGSSLRKHIEKIHKMSVDQTKVKYELV